jgi:quercetin 2,3-dioxygenase
MSRPTEPEIRPLALRAPARATSDGAGVRLMRSLGSPAVGVFDPFLMLDEFRSDDPDDYIAGFPDHPHRGFETVTIVLAGSIEHKDSKGNTGNLVAGSVQWMTAGRGIIHSEMPEQEQGLLWGFQLWVNLPAERKLCEPRYQDIPPDAIPMVERSGAKIRVIAGELDGTAGAVSGIETRPTLLDVELAAESRLEVDLPAELNAFVYVYDGAVHTGPERETVPAHQIGLLGAGDRVVLETEPDRGARLLLVAGKPIGEPIAWHGPFVMNTKEEILQAIRDFQAGRLTG